MKRQRIRISIKSGEELAGMILSNPNFSGKRPVILVIHGWTSQMSRYPQRLAPEIDMGYIAVLFDMRGHGQTGGSLNELSLRDHLNDCLFTYDYMVSLSEVDISNISVFGSSYGGYLASLLTAERKVHHLVLNVPALYPDEIFNKSKLQRSQQTSQYRESFHGPEDNRALKAVNNFNDNLLLIQAEKDEVLPGQVMKSYRSAAQSGYDFELIKGANHSMTTLSASESRNKILAEWFRKFK